MTTLYEGYTEEQLKEAFDSVANPDDWRADISTDVPVLSDTGEPTDLVVIHAAIMFYAGTSAGFELVQVQPSVLRVTAAGYRNGPCGP